MKKLITFSLFGNAQIYQYGAIQNARLAKSIYPGWNCRFYVSQEISLGVLRQLEQEHAEIVPMIRKSQFDGTFWRFLPASEKDLKALIIRDTDSRLNAREAEAVAEWMQSDKPAPHYERSSTSQVPLFLVECGESKGTLSAIWLPRSTYGRSKDF